MDDYSLKLTTFSGTETFFLISIANLKTNPFNFPNGKELKFIVEAVTADGT